MPNIVRKADSDSIREFLQELSNRSWLRNTARSWWPEYIYHITDVKNVVQILQDGALQCRSRLPDIPVDSASHQVINMTPTRIKDFVRLYFRPVTPTQYHMEGFRPADQLSTLGAYCPMPVFLMFDAYDILSRKDCQFSDGGLGRELPPQLLSTAEDLRNLPFQSIYHDRPIRWDEDNRRIVYHRNAEVLVPNRLDLSGLRVIACRSYAEKDTLLSLLPTNIRIRYQSIIKVATRARLFYKYWTFIEEVRLAQDRIDISFYPDTETPGPFEGEFELTNLETGTVATEPIPNLTTTDYPDGFWITLPFGQEYYRLRVKLDGYLAYQGEYNLDEEIPF